MNVKLMNARNLSALLKECDIDTLYTVFEALEVEPYATVFVNDFSLFYRFKFCYNKCNKITIEFIEKHLDDDFQEMILIRDGVSAEMFSLPIEYCNYLIQSLDRYTQQNKGHRVLR